MSAGVCRASAVVEGRPRVRRAGPHGPRLGRPSPLDTGGELPRREVVAHPDIVKPNTDELACAATVTAPVAGEFSQGAYEMLLDQVAVTRDATTA
ncbi:hypothetical protein ACFV2U_43245 [Streptomyces sp. NPDC059697]|uniref:hypothetical protein n=1 Tax=Streptomyces sp. NPDC059697 TaxID=3346912 RepID=UPI0036C67EAB